MQRWIVSAVLLLTAWLHTAPAAAQGLQTGMLQGSVVDAGGLVVPGVTITVTSPALQGARTSVSDGNGAYVFRGLPPGTYTVAFELTGFQRVEQQATVELGGQTEVNATMPLEGVSETVNVTADTITSTIVTPTAGQNLSYGEVSALPINRTPFNIAALAPGLTTNTPNGGQVTISGAFSYDNVFLVDGVDINDNLFGSANNLFIEDAIDETQVLTSGISAEYGRFSGGVINAVTKSGGDIFSGSYRLNLTNDAWQARTPFEVDSDIDRRSKFNLVHEATAGGPILESRLWFFGAVRYAKLENQITLPVTGVPFDTEDENKRGELKLTGTLAENHTLSGSYLNNSRSVRRVAFGSSSVDPKVAESPEFPNDRWVASYRGVLTSKLFAELRYSQKHFGFRGSGGTDTDLRTGSPFWTLAEGYQYHAPYFDATDPEDRDNRQVAGSLSYFLTTERTGSHDIKGGFEVYNSRRTGGNSQSPTGYVFDADFVQTAGGDPVFDQNGDLIPIFAPGETYYENWIATRGAELDIRTTSLYVQDRWQAARKLTFDLGARYERVRSESTGGIVGVDTDTLVPRLAATYDVHGDGRLVAQTTYAHYAGKYSESQFGNNSTVGNPSVVFALYTGPAGQGNFFAPGFDLNNYEPFAGTFPDANVAFEENLSSPLTKEFTASLGSQFGPRAYVKGTYVYRTQSNFVEDFIDIGNGETFIPAVALTLTNSIYRNTDLPFRDYQALQFVGRYQLTPSWQVAGNWTTQLENDGNYAGEAENQPAISSVIGDFASLSNGQVVNTIYSDARHYPTGRLSTFQRHKGRVWTTYSLGVGRFGTADLSVLYRFDSPLTFSYAAQRVPLTGSQEVAGAVAGYQDLPSSQTLYFGERGTGEFERSHLLDFGLQYQIPVFQSLRPYFKMDVFNVFNAHPLIEFNTTVRPDPNGPRDALGLPTSYIEGASFGNATAVDHFPRARAFQVALGFRF